MKLPDYARSLGVSWRTAYRMFQRGEIPGAYQLPTGTIIVPDPQTEDHRPERTVVYARVNNSSRRSTDLERQAERLVSFCNARGWIVEEVVKEMASGLNDHRPKLERLLTREPLPTRVVVEHKDRLTRFGFRYLELLGKAQGFEIVVVNPSEDDEEDLMSDFVSIITSYCARLYGQRRGKRKTEVITQELRDAAD